MKRAPGLHTRGPLPASAVKWIGVHRKPYLTCPGVIVNAIRACVLGCRNADNLPFRAAPGLLVCNVCSTKLRAVLDDIQGLYRRLTDIDELIPGGHGDTGGGRKPPGPRSPAVDALLVHTDRRSVTGTHESPAALASIEGWARMIREERSLDVQPGQMLATVPAGRVTMAREMQTLRFHWDWIMEQPWVDEFAAEMQGLRAALQRAAKTEAPVLRIGACPVRIALIDLPGDEVTIECGASLQVRADAEEIRCRNCGTIWPRSRWDELGDEWTDYAFLSAEMGVPAATLRGWCVEDGWRKRPSSTSKKRVLVCRVDALNSYAERRAGKVA